jgi:hypothetical protein
MPSMHLSLQVLTWKNCTTTTLFPAFFSIASHCSLELIRCTLVVKAVLLLGAFFLRIAIAPTLLPMRWRARGKPVLLTMFSKKEMHLRDEAHTDTPSDRDILNAMAASAVARQQLNA